MHPPFEKGNKFAVGTRTYRRPTEYAARCRRFAEKKLWPVLEHWALQKRNWKASLTAIQTILAYGYGKPREQIKIESNVPVTIQQLFANIRAAGFNGVPADGNGNDPGGTQLENANAERSEMVRDGSVGPDALVVEAAGNGLVGEGSQKNDGEGMRE